MEDHSSFSKRSTCILHAAGPWSHTMGSDDVQHRQVGTAMQGATPWSCRACVAECDLWRDLGAQCRWIRCVDRLDGDMPMRILRPLPKWSHDGSGRRSRDRSWQSDPEICPYIRRLLSVSFSGFLHFGDRSYRVSMHVEDTFESTRDEDKMWGTVRSRSLPHASKASRQGWN